MNLDSLIGLLLDLVGQAGDHPRHVDALLALAALHEPGGHVLVRLRRQVGVEHLAEAADGIALNDSGKNLRVVKPHI